MSRMIRKFKNELSGLGGQAKLRQNKNMTFDLELLLILVD